LPARPGSVNGQAGNAGNCEPPRSSSAGRRSPNRGPLYAGVGAPAYWFSTELVSVVSTSAAGAIELAPRSTLAATTVAASAAILVRHDLDEGAEGHDADHLAHVVLADLDLAGQVADDLFRLGRRLAIHRPDHHSTVVLDVDTGHARVFDDLADHLAAGTDHFA